MVGEGNDLPAGLTAFEQARQALREDGRERDDVVMDVLDCRVGWCGPPPDPTR